MPVGFSTTPGGLLLPLAVVVPFAGVLAGLVAGGRNVVRVAAVTIFAGLGIAARPVPAVQSQRFVWIGVFLHARGGSQTWRAVFVFGER